MKTSYTVIRDRFGRRSYFSEAKQLAEAARAALARARNDVAEAREELQGRRERYNALEAALAREHARGPATVVDAPETDFHRVPRLVRNGSTSKAGAALASQAQAQHAALKHFDQHVKTLEAARAERAQELADCEALVARHEERYRAAAQRRD
jgi:hypothetical protein